MSKLVKRQKPDAANALLSYFSSFDQSQASQSNNNNNNQTTNTTTELDDNSTDRPSYSNNQSSSIIKNVGDTVESVDDLLIRNESTRSKKAPPSGNVRYRTSKKLKPILPNGLKIPDNQDARSAVSSILQSAANIAGCKINPSLPLVFVIERRPDGSEIVKLMNQNQIHTLNDNNQSNMAATFVEPTQKPVNESNCNNLSQNSSAALSRAKLRKTVVHRKRITTVENDPRHNESVMSEVQAIRSKIFKSERMDALNDCIRMALHPPYKCPHCDYVNTKRYLLVRHLQSHSQERAYLCSICQQGFKSHVSLRNHLNTHTGDKPYACRICQTRFTTSGERIRHTRYKHTLERPHKCDYCDYASVELSKLKRHMASHSGERPFQCPKCAYASTDAYKLRRHVRVHDGLKPYECDVCHARFTQRNSLKLHAVSHTERGVARVHVCEQCPSSFKRKNDLCTHMRRMHRALSQAIKCARCAKVFHQLYDYRHHLRTECESQASTMVERVMETIMSSINNNNNSNPKTDAEKCKPKNSTTVNIDEATFSTVVAPKIKMERKFKERNAECPHCKRAFKSSFYLKRHLLLCKIENSMKITSDDVATINVKDIQIDDVIRSVLTRTISSDRDDFNRLSIDNRFSDHNDSSSCDDDDESFDFEAAHAQFARFCQENQYSANNNTNYNNSNSDQPGPSCRY